MTLSVVIPVYNEEPYLNRFISDIVSRLDQAKLDYEIILSENGSLDRTRSIARKLVKTNPRLRLITSPVANYGLAVKNGFLAATGQYLVLFDLDYYNIPFILSALPLLKNHAAVIAAKHHPHSQDSRSFTRRLATLIFSTILRLLFGLKISDTHGIKILNRQQFLPLIHQTRLTREIFDTELLIRAQYQGLFLTEIGIDVAEKRQSRTSIFKRALKTLWDLLVLKFILLAERSALASKKAA